MWTTLAEIYRISLGEGAEGVPSTLRGGWWAKDEIRVLTLFSACLVLGSATES